jgi:hypothetical protein
MNIIEQIGALIVQHFTNPIFEPIIIDKQIIDIFVSKMKLGKSNIKLLSKLRNKLLENDSIFQTNLCICIDIIIKTLQSNKDTISQLKKENLNLRMSKECLISQLRKKKQVLVLRNPTTIPFTLA